MKIFLMKYYVLLTALSLVIGCSARTPEVASVSSSEDSKIVSESGKGDIPKSEIKARIEGSLKKIKRCYNKALFEKEDLEGKVVTNFIIGIEGRVTSIKVKETTINHLPVETCVQHEVSKIKFPKPGKGIVEVVYPFMFNVKK